MTEEEIKKAYKNHDLKSWGFNFTTPKSTYLVYSLIATFEGKRFKNY